MTRRRPLRHRLLASYLCVTMAFVVALVVSLAVVHARSRRDEATDRLQRSAFVVAASVEDQLEEHREPERGPIEAVLREELAGTDGRAEVVTSTGEQVAQIGSPITDATELVRRALRGTAPTRHGDGRFTAAVPVSTQGTVIGAVVLDQSSAPVDRELRHYWAALAALVVVASVVVGASGLLLARFVSSPLDDLRRVANRLGAGDLTARATTGRGPSEVQDLAEDFNRTADRLGSLLRSQSAFAADASHQLRTPLTALRLQLENLAAELEEGAAAPTATRDDVDSAIAETERLSRLVDGLLALARAEAPPSTTGAHGAAIDVGDLLTARVEAWQPLALELGVALDLGACGPAALTADLDRVTQSLDNLIANALDATAAGGHVTLEATVLGDRVQLHVVDDGRGLTAADRSRAFDRFWRAPGSTVGPFGGSGLGLAIVARLAEADRGTAWLAEAEGGGTDAVLELPSARAPSAAPHDGRRTGPAT